MSDIRFDPISGYWVTIAPNRNDRPVEFIPSERVMKRLLCPFCAGNETQTPGNLAAYDLTGETVADDLSWMVRVVPNKYPSFSVEGGNDSQLPKANSQAPGNGLYDSFSSHGIQELVIPSARHLVSLGQLSHNEARVTMIAYRDRIKAAREKGLAHAMLFTNCRSSAGASLEHIHTQLIASPILGTAVQERTNRSNKYLEEHGQQLVHALADWEREQGDRIVERTGNFTTICPFASRFPFQVWIVPNPDLPTFLDCSKLVVDELALLIRQQIRRLESVLDEPAYNVLFHLPPFAEMDSLPWFVEVFPRLTTSAGFELGTDIWVNPVSPETATRRLKQVDSLPAE